MGNHKKYINKIACSMAINSTISIQTHLIQLSHYRFIVRLCCDNICYAIFIALDANIPQTIDIKYDAAILVVVGNKLDRHNEPQLNK